MLAVVAWRRRARARRRCSPSGARRARAPRGTTACWSSASVRHPRTRCWCWCPAAASGAGAFGFVGPRSSPGACRGLQVRAVERREHAFEDTSVIERGDPDQSLAYYLQGQPVDGHTFQPPPAGEVGFMGRWGLGLLLGDLRRVIRKARAGGRRVILGGHSLGASAAEAYASWDFDGRPGHRDLAGLVLIDGGLDGRMEQPTLAQARAQLREFETAPRFDPVQPARPVGLRRRLGDRRPLRARAAAETAHRWTPSHSCPPPCKPPFPSTNETWLGWVRSLLYPSARSGRRARRAPRGHRQPARLGRRRHHTDRTPRALARPGADQHSRLVRPAPPAARRPSRRLRSSPRASHACWASGSSTARAIHLPLYAFQTSSSAPHVLRAARRLARISRIASPTLAADLTMIHSDPLTALPARNSFLRTVTPFLKHLAALNDRRGRTRAGGDPRLVCRKVEPGGRRGDQRVAAPSSWMNVLCGVGASPTSASIARSRTRTTCDHVLLVEADDQDEARLRIRAALGGREEFDARQPVDSWTVITRRLARRQRAARGSAANSGVVYCSQHVERGAAAAVRDVSGRASQHLHRKGRRRMPHDVGVQELCVLPSLPTSVQRSSQGAAPRWPALSRLLYVDLGVHPCPAGTTRAALLPSRPPARRSSSSTLGSAIE